MNKNLISQYLNEAAGAVSWNTIMEFINYIIFILLYHGIISSHPIWRGFPHVAYENRTLRDRKYTIIVRTQTAMSTRQRRVSRELGISRDWSDARFEGINGVNIILQIECI